MSIPQLIICPSCKAQIADSARVCPHCGHNFSVFTNRLIGLVILALFVAMAITQLAPTPVSTATTGPTATPAPTATPKPTASPPSAPLTLKGKGAQVSSPIALKHGLAIFKLTHDGQRNFAVMLLNADGDLVALMANKIGPFGSSMAMGIPVDGYYVVNVEADGNWTVSVGISATESPRT